eukprot:9500215-Pyramimonas_sp.AAC.2
MTKANRGSLSQTCFRMLPVCCWPCLENLPWYICTHLVLYAPPARPPPTPDRQCLNFNCKASPLSSAPCWVTAIGARPCDRASHGPDVPLTELLGMFLGPRFFQGCLGCIVGLSRAEVLSGLSGVV